MKKISLALFLPLFTFHWAHAQLENSEQNPSKIKDGSYLCSQTNSSLLQGEIAPFEIKIESSIEGLRIILPDEHINVLIKPDCSTTNADPQRETVRAECQMNQVTLKNRSLVSKSFIGTTSIVYGVQTTILSFENETIEMNMSFMPNRLRDILSSRKNDFTCTHVPQRTE